MLLLYFNFLISFLACLLIFSFAGFVSKFSFILLHLFLFFLFFLRLSIPFFSTLSFLLLLVLFFLPFHFCSVFAYFCLSIRLAFQTNHFLTWIVRSSVGCLHDTGATFIPLRVKSVRVHPGNCTGARLKNSFRCRVKAVRLFVWAWNHSPGSLDRVAHV